MQGNETYKKKATSRLKQGKEWHGHKYYFNREQCRNCPKREECIGKATSVGKILNIGENAPEYYEYSQKEKTEEFKEKYKSRAIIEPKNAEMKRFHGLARAGGYGLVSVEKQAKLTVIAVNLKRICKLVSSQNPKKSATDLIAAADFKIFIVICQIQGNNGRKTATFSVVSNRPLDSNTAVVSDINF